MAIWVWQVTGTNMSAVIFAEAETRVAAEEKIEKLNLPVGVTGPRSGPGEYSAATYLMVHDPEVEILRQFESAVRGDTTAASRPQVAQALQAVDRFRNGSQ